MCAVIIKNIVLACTGLFALQGCMTWSLSTGVKNNINVAKPSTFAFAINVKDSNARVPMMLAARLLKERMIGLDMKYDSVNPEIIVVCQFRISDSPFMLTVESTNRVFFRAPDFMMLTFEDINDRIGYVFNEATTSIAEYQNDRKTGLFKVKLIENKTKQVIAQYSMQGRMHSSWTQELAATMPYLFRNELAWQ